MNNFQKYLVVLLLVYFPPSTPLEVVQFFKGGYLLVMPSAFNFLFIEPAIQISYPLCKCMTFGCVLCLQIVLLVMDTSMSWEGRQMSGSRADRQKGG